MCVAPDVVVVVVGGGGGGGGSCGCSKLGGRGQERDSQAWAGDVVTGLDWVCTRRIEQTSWWKILEQKKKKITHPFIFSLLPRKIKLIN